MINQRLVDEVVLTSSYIDAGNVDSVEFVGLSYAAYSRIKEELREEGLDVDKDGAIDDALTIKHFIIPSLIGISYKFFIERRP